MKKGHVKGNLDKLGVFKWPIDIYPSVLEDLRQFSSRIPLGWKRSQRTGEEKIVIILLNWGWGEDDLRNCRPVSPNLIPKMIIKY